MDMRSVQHQVVAREWQQRILIQKSSGLSVRKWCAENNVRESRYYYWLKILRNDELSLSKPVGVFAELQQSEITDVSAPSASVGICAVIRGSGLCLEIHNGADPRTLEATMKSLGMTHP
jgi:hypothetical protein